MKKSLDGNLEKTLANLESHPALFKRCQRLYLEKIVECKTCVELAEEHKLHVSTVSRYIEAYRKVAERYADSPTVSDALTFCHAEIARLIAKRKDVVSARDYKDLTSEIRHYQMMVNEILGFTRKGTEININYVTNTINVITESLPELLEQYLPRETVNNILLALAQKLEDNTMGAV